MICSQMGIGYFAFGLNKLALDKLDYTHVKALSLDAGYTSTKPDSLDVYSRVYGYM